MTNIKPKNFLAKLEIQGFKSFGNKTTFEFPDRITCIVGPNGSGKSNIIDAIRWALGERESKNLRGTSLEHLIFSGTPQKPAAAFARVDLFFNNQDKLFPFDAEEVVLSRKIYRSGESEIFLNDAEIKLKDLLPLLAKVKLGTKGITIIKQGQSDIFVISTPQERREMIEEVLGLKEFRLKKLQSEKRLANSLINIDKIKASLEELLPQVKVYKKQKARLEKRNEIAKELAELTNTYYSFQLYQLQKELQKNINPLNQLLEQKNNLEQEIKEEEREINKISHQDTYHELNALKSEIEKIWTIKTQKERMLFKLEAMMEAQKNFQFLPSQEQLVELIDFIKIQIENALKIDNLHTIKQILNEIKLKIQTLYENKNKNQHEKQQEDEKNNLIQEIKKLETEWQKLKTKEAALEEKIKNENIAFKEKIEKLNDKKEQLYHLEGEIQKIKMQEENLKIKMNSLIAEWENITKVNVDLNQLSPPKVELTEEELNKLENKITRLRNELIAIGEIDENVLKEFENAEQKFNFLSQQLKDLEKATADLKMLIKQLDHQIKTDFQRYFREVNEAFNHFFNTMFDGGRARLVLEKKQKSLLEKEIDSSENNQLQQDTSLENEEEKEQEEGIEIEVHLPRKKVKSIHMLSGGEKTLVSLAALFALISVSPPPFLVLDEIDAALDEENARRFAEIIKQFSQKTQFLIVTHNRATMEVADVLYGITMGEDGVSKILSLKLES